MTQILPELGKIYTSASTACTLIRFFHLCFSIPCLQVYTMSLSQYHESNTILLGLGRNPVSHWNKSHFTLEQIQFHIGTNPILHWNKSNITLDQIQIMKKSILTLEKMQFNIWINLIHHWNKSYLSLKHIQCFMGYTS